MMMTTNKTEASPVVNYSDLKDAVAEKNQLAKEADALDKQIQRIEDTRRQK
jgi:adenylate kinase